MSDDRPGSEVLRVVRGAPTPEELAALVGVVLTRRPAAPPPAATGPSPWVRSGRPGARDLRSARGPHAWRESALPG